MRSLRIFYLLGALLLFLALTMLLTSLWPLLGGGGDLTAFLWSALLTAAVGSLFYLLFSPYRPEQLTLMESYFLVTLAWIGAGLCGALPFYFYGLFEGSFLSAFFESISGFSTTGATLLADVEQLPRGLLFWRCFTQWLGGMGIIVLTVAVLPRFGFRSPAIFKAEFPGPVSERLVPRMVETARRLWFIYVGLTVLLCLLLILSGVDYFNALTHAFTTLATGGFSTFNDSVGSFHNPLVEMIIALFMFAGGINFTLYYRVLRGDLRGVKRNEELRFYIIFTAVAIALICANIYPHYGGNLFETLRRGAFQVISIVTTSGFVTADFDGWPNFARTFLLLLMFVGACGGSTSGAIKQVRFLILFKYSYRELYRLVHPSMVSAVKLGEQPVSEDTIRGVAGFTFLYVLLFVLATLALSGLGLDLVTSLSAAASSLGNVGPGLGRVGPMLNYRAVPPAGILLLSAMMILGRLEIYTVLVLLLPLAKRFAGKG